MTISNSGFRAVQAGSQHLDSVAPLFDQYRVFYDQPSDVVAARRFISDRLKYRDSVIFAALAEDSDKLIAFGFAQLYPAFSSISMKRLWILNDLFVVPEARNRGVARKLMERARRLAEDTGAKGIVLETAIDNRAAQALYEDLGYQRDDEFVRYYLYI
jgi:ribosomal protein S18 acetylase RimI-like enzyme